MNHTINITEIISKFLLNKIIRNKDITTIVFENCAQGTLFDNSTK